MRFSGTPRPAARWHHATTKLDDFAIISYRVALDVVARHLPEGFEPEAFPSADGAETALVSAVPFKDRDFHFRFFPKVAISCGQINYRTYVRAYGERGVWFFGTSLDHPLVSVPRTLWRMPWSRSRISISAEWTESRARWSMTAADFSGRSHCDLVERPGSPQPLDGFASADEVLTILTHPTTGWYRRRGGGIGRYSIWHPVMQPRSFQVETARFSFLDHLGIITRDTRPHSALAQRSLHFDIHTPPRRLAR